MKQFLPRLLFMIVFPANVLAQDEPSWNTTLDKISSGVVSIQVDSTRAFDTDRNQSTQATGFVVDAEQGLVLTNRHVVTTGPVVAQAIFLNQEEVELVPLYRDPVHDFGFFRYDPRKLRFIKPEELKLVPEAAQIGRDIRIVGNDAGEQLSILAGTIARVDRAAPNYGRGNYNDFNTFYLQAASGTSGGSSGSPVVDIAGRVVALNAGANSQAASSFFLPLERVRRALSLIREGHFVSRGTLQTEFIHKPYAELRRLGLAESTEASYREDFPVHTGLLVVEQVIPNSAASEFLRPGDVLVSINNEPLSEFVSLAAVLDDQVGRKVLVEVERGGVRVRQELIVDDLHFITPDEFIEYGDGIFHALSYQQARHFNRSISGVYVANSGHVFGTAAIPRRSLVTGIDGIPVESLDDLQQRLEAIPDQQRATVRFVTLDDPQTDKLRLITNDRGWFPAKRCQRDDRLGLWSCRELAQAVSQDNTAPRETTFPSSGQIARFAGLGSRGYLNRVAPSLVLVNFDMPYTVSGVSDRHYYGTGVIVDAERGWVVVDRNTVPVAMGDVRITFAGSLEVPGWVEYIHPLHNLAVVAYDPELIGNTPTRSAAFNSSPKAFGSGDSLMVVGLKADHTLHSQSSAIAAVEPINFPVSRTLRFRDSNLEGIKLVNGPDEFDGIIVDQRGRVVALWASFAYQTGRDLTQTNIGIPADLVTDMVDVLRDGRSLYSLDVEWRLMPIASARKFGLPESWISRYEAHNPERRQVLAVSSVVTGSPAAAFFAVGDILLNIDGQALNTFREVESVVQRDQIEVTVYRNGEELIGHVQTVALSGRGIDRALLWAGALLQAPHRAISAQRGIDSAGVYVSYFGFGSPASRSRLFAGLQILEVDGQPTPNLDSFIAAVDGLQDRSSVRLSTVAWSGIPQIVTLRLDRHYWPSYELRRIGNHWQRSPLK